MFVYFKLRFASRIRRSCTMCVGGRPVTLTAREFDLLVHLMTHPGRAYTRTQLMHDVWGWEFGDTSTVTVHGTSGSLSHTTTVGLTVNPAGGTLAFEAESLSFVTNGAVAALQTDANTSGGHWLALIVFG